MVANNTWAHSIYLYINMSFGKLEQHIGNNHRIASDVGQSSTGLLISPRPSAYAKPCTPYRSCHSSFKWYTIQDPLPHRLSHILLHTFQLVTAQWYCQQVFFLCWSSDHIDSLHNRLYVLFSHRRHVMASIRIRSVNKQASGLAHSPKSNVTDRSPFQIQIILCHS